MIEERDKTAHYMPYEALCCLRRLFVSSLSCDRMVERLHVRNFLAKRGGVSFNEGVKKSTYYEESTILFRQWVYQ